MLHLDIKNEQVSQIKDRWEKIWKNKNASLQSRLKAYAILNVIDALVINYEMGETLGEEEVDDLFILWSENFKPVLPEEHPKLLESMRKSNIKESSKKVKIKDNKFNNMTEKDWEESNEASKNERGISGAEYKDVYGDYDKVIEDINSGEIPKKTGREFLEESRKNNK